MQLKSIKGMKILIAGSLKPVRYLMISVQQLELLRFDTGTIVSTSRAVYILSWKLLNAIV